MAGKKQQAPKPIEEDDEAEEGWDNVADVDADSPEQAAGRMRDWRDVEKYREMRELRRLVGDDFDFTDVIGEIPIRTGGREAPKAKPAAAPVPQKAKVPAVAPKAAPPAKAAPVPHKPAQKPAPVKAQAKPAHKVAAKSHPKPHPKPKASKPPAKRKARKR